MLYVNFVKVHVTGRKLNVYKTFRRRPGHKYTPFFHL